MNYRVLPLFFVIALATVANLPAQDNFMMPRNFVTTEGPGRPPLTLTGSDEILARDALVGTWQVTYLERAGHERPELAAQIQMRFSRGKIELMQQGYGTTVVSYSLDFSLPTPGMSWIVPRHTHMPTQRGLYWCIQRGIYWVEGDTLMICVGPINSVRATEFLTQPIDGATLYILKRQNPTPPTPATPPAPEPSGAP
jgi:hypothetical protein